MSYEQLLSLREKLTNFETETSHQIVVLTIDTLGDETIENYAFQVFNLNKLGQADEDNGLLILFSEEDREVRIEVGYGLEPIITDAISSRLVRNVMIPEFKEQRYFEGIDLVTNEIIKIISDPRYAEEFANTDEDFTLSAMPFWIKFFVVLFFGGFLSIFFFVGFHLLKSAYKDLVNAYRGLISGEISVLSFPFMLVGILFTLLFGFVFAFTPLVAFSFILSQIVFHVDIESTVNSIINSNYLNLKYVMLVTGFLLFGLPILIAILIVKRYDKGFKFSLVKNNKSYIKRNISLRSSNSLSRSSGSSRSSSRSSFSGGGGSSGGGGASGSW